MISSGDSAQSRLSHSLITALKPWRKNSIYSLTMAIYNLIRYRRMRIAIYTASKVLALASSLVSLFFLQTAMFAVFGDGAAWERLMNLFTGGTVHAAIVYLAILLLKKEKTT